MRLREYQIKSLTLIFKYMEEKPGKNPCLVLPTGAGKSVIIASFIKQCFEWWPDIKIMILCHQKELLEQDSKELYKLIPEVPFGFYSSGIGQKDLSKPITFASIQSIRKVSCPEIKIILVDEAHLINNDNKGIYRNFLNRTNATITIGLTATPYRLGQGYITDGEGIFDDLICPVSILELQNLGHLAKLRSKGTFTKLDLSDLRLRAGDFIESELQDRLDVFSTNEAVVKEIIASAKFYNKKHILIFCSGIEHAIHVSDLLNDNGLSSVYVTGKQTTAEREKALADFTSGDVHAISNANLLTTGFNYPDIDMIVMLRPTMSPGLYLQMAGRGLRLKSDGGDCLVLDFAGNVMRHGPIAFVQPPVKKKESSGGGVAPCKECPECLEIVPIQVSTCPTCGYVFPKHSMSWVLFEGDVNGDGLEKIDVWKWSWYLDVSRKTKVPMIICDFRANAGNTITKFFFVFHQKMSAKSRVELLNLAKRAGVNTSGMTIETEDDWYKLIKIIEEQGNCPKMIITKRDGKYRQVVRMLWDDDIDEIKKQKEIEDKSIEEARKRLYDI